MPFSPSADLDIKMIFKLMGIASLVAVSVKWIKIPYTIALVLVGLCLSFFHVMQPVELTEHLVLFVMLPALLFEAAWNLKLSHLKKSGWIILILATIGVAFSIGLIGWLLHTILHFPLLVSLLFGAMVAPTDPVSVVAIMKLLKLDHYLAALVEGESLCNDATAVVFFKLLVSVLILNGANATPDILQGYAFGAFVQFILVMGGGALIGALVGACFISISKFWDDHLLELTFTTITAYGSFLLAESITVPGQIPHLHLSGVISTVSAGLVMGNLSRKAGMTSSTRIIISSFWEYAAFFMNSLIFLLIGLEIQISHLLTNWFPITVAIGAALLARILMVYGTSLFVNTGRKLKKKDALPLAWQHVLFWGGLRGALSMALVLSIPKAVISPEYRELLILMVFGVVLYTLVFQGTTISWLIKLLKFGGTVSLDYAKHQELKARLVSAQQALAKLTSMVQVKHSSPKVEETLKKELNTEIETLNKSLQALQVSNEMLVFQDQIEAKTQLLHLRKAVTSDLILQGAVSEEIGNRLKAEFTDSLEELEQEHFSDQQ